MPAANVFLTPNITRALSRNEKLRTILMTNNGDDNSDAQRDWHDDDTDNLYK